MLNAHHNLWSRKLDILHMIHLIKVHAIPYIHTPFSAVTVMYGVHLFYCLGCLIYW